MRFLHHVLAVAITLAPALPLIQAGCAAPQAAGPRWLAGPPAPRGHPVDDAGDVDDLDPPDDPCADPDALDGLDDPCYVDVPEEEVRRALAGRGRGTP
jgi:hypothetical protein